MKKFTLTVTEDDNGNTMSSTNEGFTALEILGILEYKQDDVLSQMKGIIKPNKITRNLIIDEDSKDEKSTD